MTRVKGRYLSILCVLLAVFLPACKFPTFSDADPDTVPPVAGLAPKLVPDRVFVQSYDVSEQKAVAIGLTGAASSGVTEICVELANGSKSCFPSNSQDGSFRGLLDGAKPGDIVKLWGNGPTFLLGGPGLNSINERVQYWRTRFPVKPSVLLKTADRLYMGSDEGVWFLPNADLSKAPETLYPSKYDMLDGLPDTHIRSLVSDGAGGIWIGTHFGGISHLTFATDGKPVFTNYYQGSISYARKLLVEPNGCLWIGSSGVGLTCLTFNSFNEPQYQTYKASNSDLPNDVIIALVQDRPSSIWVGTEGGLSHVEIQPNRSVLFTNYDQAGGFLPNNIVQSLAVDANGILWAGTKNGLCKIELDGTGQPVSFVTETTANGLPNNAITALSKDDGTGIWIGTNYKGLSHRTILPDGTSSYRNESGFLHGNILATIADGSGGAWVGSNGGGLAHYAWSETQGSQIRNYYDEEGLPSNYIRALLPDPDGSFLVGTGAGLMRMTFDSQDKAQFARAAEPGVLPQDWVSSLAYAPSGAIWIGTSYNGGITRLTYDANGVPQFYSESVDEGLLNDEVTSVYVESEESLWIGTWEGLSHRIEVGAVGQYQNYTMGNSPFPGEKVFAISSDLCGGVWVGHDEGLTHLSFDVGGNPVFRNYAKAPTLSWWDVFALLPVSCREVWVGALGGLSLVKLQETGATFTNYSQYDGLDKMYGNSNIMSILGDGQGGLWLGTRGGLTHAKPDSNGRLNFDEHYSPADGLPSVYIQTLVPFSDDSFLLGTDGGLILFRP